MIRSDLGGHMPCPCHSGPDLDRGESGLGVQGWLPQDHGEGFCHRSPSVPPLGEGPATTQHEETTPSLAHEISDHGQLVAGEEACFDTTENQASVLKQLLSRPGEATTEFLSVVHIQSKELVFRRTLEDHNLHVLVIGHSLSKELELVPRLTFEVEDLLPVLPDIHLNGPFIVLGHLLSVLHRNPEANPAGSRFIQCETDPGDDRFTIIPELDLTLGEDPVIVLHHQGQRLAREAPLGDHHIKEERGSLQHCTGR